MKTSKLFIILLTCSFFQAHSQFLCGNILIDSRDGIPYKTVLIGNQCWMAENLNYGSMIKSSNKGSQMSQNNNIEKYCWNNDVDFCDGTNGKKKLGGFYEWNEAVQYTEPPFEKPFQGICPAGWHLPTKKEFETLTNKLGGQTLAGTKLKEGGNSGFEGTLSGYRCSMNGSFRNSAIETQKSSYYWALDVNDSGHAYFYQLYEGSDVFAIPTQYALFNNSIGLSIRCVKDKEVTTDKKSPKLFNIEKVLIVEEMINVFFYTYYVGVKHYISLYNSEGEKVYHGNVRAAEGNNLYQINSKKIKKGVYIVKIEANQASDSKNITLK